MTKEEKIEKLLEFGKEDINLISHKYTIQSNLMNSITSKDIQDYIKDKGIVEIQNRRKIPMLQHIVREIKKGKQNETH